MIAKNYYQKVVPFILFVLALILFFKLIQPMIVVLLGSFLLAYVSFPLYKKLSKKISYTPLAIILSLLIIVLIVLIPFIFLLFSVIQQGYYFSNSLSTNVEKGALFGFSCVGEDSEVCQIINQAEKFSLEQLSKTGLDTQIEKLLPVLQEKITGMLLGFPLMFAKIFLAIIIAYFVLKDWKIILQQFKDLIPMRQNTKERIIREFEGIAYTVIYAQLFVALVQGIVATIGFYLFGIPFPLFFGVLLALCALIPAIGTGIIWLPASAYLILLGYFSDNYWILGKGFGLLFYSLLIITTIDDLLLAKIVHSRVRVNQVVIIVGVIGGASLFGVVGIFIGPILLPLLITYFKTFKERFD